MSCHDAVHQCTNKCCNALCQGYFATSFALLEAPYAGVTCLRNATWESCALFVFGCALAEIGYLLLLPLYFVAFSLFGLFSLLTMPLQLSPCTSHEMKSRFFDIFFAPCVTALQLLKATVRAVFLDNFSTPHMKELPTT